MVDYATWTRIAFRTAESKGFRAGSPRGGRTSAGGRAFSGDEPQIGLIRVIAAVWQDRKAELSAASETTARGIAEQEIVVERSPQ